MYTRKHTQRKTINYEICPEEKIAVAKMLEGLETRARRSIATMISKIRAQQNCKQGVPACSFAEL